MFLAAWGFTAAAGAARADNRAAAAAPSSLESRTFKFHYGVTIRDIPSDAKHLAIWVPIPQTDRHQTVRDLKIQSPLPYRTEKESHYGNTILHLESDSPLPSSIDLVLDAVVERQAYTVLGNGAEKPRDDKPSKRDLEADRLVPIDGKIAVTAAEVTRDAKTPMQQARAIYDYVTQELKYDKSGQGWGRGDAVYACDVRRGNCTDFHSLIIGMARARGIPARFVIGFPLPEDRKQGDIAGYHCWAELYVQGVGWLPVDSSEASKHPEKRELFFGGLDANRIELTTGRDLELRSASDPLNFLVYPHVEVDGKPFGGVDKRFSFSDLGT
jgi:hypothetical protein